MKIGIVGSIWLNTPPKGYGGTEDVVYNLVNGLTDNGHDVTLFGPATAKVKAKVFPTVSLPLRENNIEWTNCGYTLLHITRAFDYASQFDILHVHLNKIQDYLALALAVYSKTPVLFTLHFRLPHEKEKARQDRYLLLNKYAALPFTSISNAQRKPINLNYIRTIYNALDLKRFPFSERKGTYLVWLGKVNPLKGTKDAILAARKAGIKIYVMGTIDRGIPEMLTYYEHEVKPLMRSKEVVWLGEVSHNEKTSILSGAKAFLNPIHWEEPFGLVMAEAQAVGTPVISYNRGAAPEVIHSGKSGFLVKSFDEMVNMIPKVDHLNRRDCRDNVESQFTIEKMIEGYEGAYEDTIKYWKKYQNEQKKILQG